MAKKPPPPKKEFGLAWVADPLTDEESFGQKRMFGGMAFYCFGLMVLVIMESPGDREWKGITYPFEIWDGLLIPTDRSHHASLLASFSELVPHPVLPKWLYLPQSHPSFEDIATALVRAIQSRDPRFGIVPGAKKRKKTRGRQMNKASSGK